MCCRWLINSASKHTDLTPGRVFNLEQGAHSCLAYSINTSGSSCQRVKKGGWGERGTDALQTSPAKQGKGSLRAGRKYSPELALLIKPRSPGHWHRHTQALPSPSTSGHKLKMSTEARGRRQGLGRTKPCPSLPVSARAGGLAWPDRSKQAEVCLVFLRFSRLLSIDH